MGSMYLFLPYHMVTDQQYSMYNESAFLKWLSKGHRIKTLSSFPNPNPNQCFYYQLNSESGSDEEHTVTTRVFRRRLILKVPDPGPGVTHLVLGFGSRSLGLWCGLSNRDGWLGVEGGMGSECGFEVLSSLSLLST